MSRVLPPFSLQLYNVLLCFSTVQIHLYHDNNKIQTYSHLPYFPVYKTHRPIRRTVIFSLGILEKNNDESILILAIYWKKTGLLHTKISNHNIIYSS